MPVSCAQKQNLSSAEALAGVGGRKLNFAAQADAPEGSDS